MSPDITLFIQNTRTKMITESPSEYSANVALSSTEKLKPGHYLKRGDKVISKRYDNPDHALMAWRSLPSDRQAGVVVKHIKEEDESAQEENIVEESYKSTIKDLTVGDTFYHSHNMNDKPKKFEVAKVTHKNGQNVYSTTSDARIYHSDIDPKHNEKHRINEEAEVIEEGHVETHIQQTLADRDINSEIKGGKLVVHRSNLAKAKYHVKKLGHTISIIGGLNESESHKVILDKFATMDNLKTVKIPTPEERRAQIAQRKAEAEKAAKETTK